MLAGHRLLPPQNKWQSESFPFALEYFRQSLMWRQTHPRPAQRTGSFPPEHPATPAAVQFHGILATPTRPTFALPATSRGPLAPTPRARIYTSAGTKQPWQQLPWLAMKKRPKRQNEAATDRMARVVQRAVEEKSQPPLEVKREARGKFHPPAPVPARYVAHARQLRPVQLPA